MTIKNELQTSSKLLNFMKILGLVVVFVITMLETGYLSQAAKARTWRLVRL